MSTTSTYTVHGMTCGGCAAKVTHAVGGVHGVADASVDLSGGTVTVVGDSVDGRAVRTAITDAGYRVG